MRVIAGTAGGIQLAVPKRGVRPTMDRVKAAIFSSLADKVSGARVLDLFAGSGSLGIEALSRGAASALFVDQDRQAINAIEQNLKKTKLEGKTRQHDVFEFLNRQPGSGSLGQFDLIFAQLEDRIAKDDFGFAAMPANLFTDRFGPFRLFRHAC